MHEELKKLIDRSIELLKVVQTIESGRKTNSVSLFQVNDLASRGANLIQSAVGAKSVYLENLRNAHKQKTTVAQFYAVAGVLQAFHTDLSKGHLVNIRHEIEAVVVSKILTQATRLARTKGVHPAVAVIVACAGIEEFCATGVKKKVSPFLKSNDPSASLRWNCVPLVTLPCQWKDASHRGLTIGTTQLTVSTGKRSPKKLPTG